MKLSVIIPMYNVEKYISTTLYSLINQNNKNFEVILVDDGSTDNTYNTAKSILSKGELIDYKFIKQKNSGVSSARNRGLVETTGDYILFLDGDDYVSKNLIQTIKEAKYNLEPDVICWGYNTVKMDGTVISNYFDNFNPDFYEIKGTEALKKIIVDKTLWIWTGSTIYKRSFLINNKLEFVEGCVNGEDQEFIYKALYKAKDVMFINKVLSFYVNREGSISNTYNIRRFDAVAAMKRTYEFINSSEKEMSYIADILMNQNISGNYFYNLHSCFSNSKEKDIKKILAEIEEKYPGLNNEMRKLLFHFHSNNKRHLFRIKLFLFSPSLYFELKNIKNKITKNLN